MEGIPKDELNEIGVVVSRVIDLACQLPEAAGRHGGYFCLASNDHKGVPKLLMLVGSVPENKAEIYCRFAMEKASRLNGTIDFTSHESRNPEKNQYGGAIMITPDIFSFSGLPERLDEAAMIVVASLVLRLDTGQIRHRAGMLDGDPNPFYKSFIKVHARFS